MAKQLWKPGNMLYPLPAVMVSVGDKNGNKNILTVAWTGTICTNPAMVYISVRPERYSYEMIRQTNEFVINLTTEKLIRATDYCGVRSGRDVDKWKEMHLTPAVHADEAYLNEKNRFELNKTGLIAYSHGEYLSLGKQLGTFGYSVRKKSKSPAGSSKKKAAHPAKNEKKKPKVKK